MVQSQKIRGVIPPVSTPLTEGDRVDEKALRRLTRHLLNAGANGIFANGSMGGFAFMTDEEQVRAIRIVVEEVNGAVPVMGGLGDTSTSRAVPKAREIVKAGVTHLTVLAPYFFIPTQEQVIAYFSEIAAAVDRPLIIYDNPVMTKCHIRPETVAELKRQVPSIVGVKESNEDCCNLQEVLRLTRGDPGFSVLTGSESLILVALQMGCDGFIGGLHNLCPYQAVALYKAFLAGDIPAARKQQDDLVALCDIFACGGVWGAFDEALRYLGIAERAGGAPFVTAISDKNKARVHALLDRYVEPATRPRPAAA